MDWQVSTRRAACSLERMNLGLTHTQRDKLSIRKTRQRSLGQSRLARRLLVWARHPQGAHPLACPALLSKAHQAVCSAAQVAHTPPLGGRLRARGQLCTCSSSFQLTGTVTQATLCTPAGDRGAPDTETAAGESLQGKTVLEG